MPPHVAARRLIGACEHAEQGRFAGAIVADEPDPIAVFEREAHVLKRAHAQPVTGIAANAPTPYRGI